MIAKEQNRPNEQELVTLLAGLSGHFETGSLQDESIQSLRETLADVLAGQDASSIRNTFFSFENSDLFFIDTISHDQLSQLQHIAAKAVKERDAGGQNLLVFVREVPIRSMEIQGSSPIWASGAAVEKTLGPFLKKDGRKIWFDFFKIEKLVAIYIDGITEPAILFNTSLVNRLNRNTLQPIADPSSEYTLVANTVWINAQILARNAPTGLYVGLRIKAGRITLSNLPQIINGRLTISPSTVVTVQLELDRKPLAEMPDADPTSQYGIDARNMDLDLPKEMSFHFSGAGGGIDKIIGNLHWTIYGHSANFKWKKDAAPRFDSVSNQILIPFVCSESTLAIKDCQSPFNTLSGTADIQLSAWALPAAKIDISRPSPAEGIGGIAIRCEKGLTAKWRGLQGGEIILSNPFVVCNQGIINIMDLQAGNIYCKQEYKLWKDNEVNPFGCSIKLQYTNAFPFVYNAFADGIEVLSAITDANPLLDRPIAASGNALDIHSKNSTLILTVDKTFQLIYLYDDNILFDNFDPNKPKTRLPEPIAVALHNALFKVTPVNGCLLFGELAEEMDRVEKGVLHLTFGIYGYLPTLPDPYAANLGSLKNQFVTTGSFSHGFIGPTRIWLLLICQTKWRQVSGDTSNVDVSFHFAPLQRQGISPSLFQRNGEIEKKLPSGNILRPSLITSHPVMKLSSSENLEAEREELTILKQLPDYQAEWDERLSFFKDDTFSLLDVSSNADQMGVSFRWFGEEQMSLVRTHEMMATDATASSTRATAVTNNMQFPLQVNGLDVVAKGFFVRTFMAPQVSWEPLINLTPPEAGYGGDPQTGPNYYPDDGGPTIIMNRSFNLVPVTPTSAAESLIHSYSTEPDNLTIAYFTLPFGLRSLAFLYKTNERQSQKPNIKFNSPSFEDGIGGGIQLQLDAGSGFPNRKESNWFRGYTMQVNNVNEVKLNGKRIAASTLGHNVTEIFNKEFFNPSENLDVTRGVPLTRIDFSGYGASIFSNWINKDARFASTSQARFDVFVGRTAHEVIQVKSIVIPWGFRVVRTITLFRVGSGYVYRHDSGWKSESDGLFDFRFKFAATPAEEENQEAYPYIIHPGVIKGLFNIINIRSAGKDVQAFTTEMELQNFYDLTPEDKVVRYNGPTKTRHVKLEPVYFDADIEIENVVQGHTNGRVPSKKILGFVQIEPRGIPITPKALEELLIRQFGSIGGPLNAIIDIGKSGQKMRLNWFDFNNSLDETNTQPISVAAARGNVILPKDGSWSIVNHTNGTGNVAPLPEDTSLPLIRIGMLDDNLTSPDNELLRIAHPRELLRKPTSDTINFGFLQSTNTQKVLFLTPSFQKQLDESEPGKLLSKTPPLFADAYRVMGSKGVFPNVGDAVNNFGDAIPLTKDFIENPLMDGDKKVLELLHISTPDGFSRIKEDGYKLLNASKDFEIPNTRWDVIKEDYLKVYVEYKAQTQNKDGTKQDRTGHLNYELDSFANDLEKRWKSRLNNIAMVVDLGSLERLMTIKGNFDAKKGAEASYKGDEGDDDFPTPQIEFSKDLEPVIEILEILQDLQGEKYASALKKGLKIAMSNSSTNIWEYKFEASKEIPVVKFPVPDELYNSPTTPLKLEASLKLGVYFNAALTTAALNDPKKILPTAGAFLDFYGRLSVMCVSVSAGSVYAIGQVNLRIAADTKVGPSLKMKFGFGAQVVVGLPIVGNVSVLYLMGTEIYADSSKLNVSASMLFQGQAELLGGIVGVNIAIEAKGTISRTGDRTDCIAQVTFALDISIFLVIDIDFSESWQEERQIA